MKRSEMVNLIAGYLEGPFTHGANWEDSEIREYASTILLALEKSGMLPPKRTKNTSWNGKKINLGNTWEPEDEEK